MIFELIDDIFLQNRYNINMENFIIDKNFNY